MNLNKLAVSIRFSVCNKEICTEMISVLAGYSLLKIWLANYYWKVDLPLYGFLWNDQERIQSCGHWKASYQELISLYFQSIILRVL